MMNSAIHKLISQYEKISHRAFSDAEQETDPIGKKIIENKTMCYFNCAQNLKTILSFASPHT
jgi:hypothetical protein